MPEDISATCCIVFKIDTAVKIMLALAILGLCGSVLNILRTLSLVTDIGGVVLIVLVTVGQLIAIFCDYKFIKVFYAHY